MDMHRVGINNTRMHFDAAKVSSLGTREEQQDALLLEISENGLFAAICDGMGGLTKGQLASQLTLDLLSDLHCNKRSTDEYPDFFIDVVDILDEQICALRNTSEIKAACGTTLVAAAIEGNRLFWFSVGDSRLYLVRSNEIVCVTIDHNYNLLLDRAFQSGEIEKTEYEMEKKNGDALVSYIGVGGIELYDINHRPFILEADDIVILMSDGLYRCVSEEEMLMIAQNNVSAKQIVTHLVRQAQLNSKGNQDNTSVIVIKINGEATL